ncbi:Chloroplastic group IIA intron splicing facilitator CRS1 [Arachis hypogaea]|nr:Chloroplastic group IIA intron splicing facilitator CRS1 [Arachis hypogaea]
MAFRNSTAKLSELPLSLRTSFLCTTASHSYQLSTLRPFSITAKIAQPKRLSKALPCHFALGRNRNLQGLAVAILKLWEKSLVVKIAVKRGILNTNNELMAEELKKLMGGTLLIRNKYFIVMYSGKDFVPTSVATVLVERQEMTKQVVDDKEKARCRAIDVTQSGADEATTQVGSLAEFYEAQTCWGRDISAKECEKTIKESAKAKNIRLFRKAQTKRLRAENLLAKIEVSLVPADPDCDQETISEEERAMFRRVGRIMKPYLPLGIGGVFDGVIENMHLNWRHRELVK